MAHYESYRQPRSLISVLSRPMNLLVSCFSKPSAGRDRPSHGGEADGGRRLLPQIFPAPGCLRRRQSCWTLSFLLRRVRVRARGALDPRHRDRAEGRVRPRRAREHTPQGHGLWVPLLRVGHDGGCRPTHHGEQSAAVPKPMDVGVATVGWLLCCCASLTDL